MRRLALLLIAVLLVGGCADMAMPVLTVEVAFGDVWNVASPTWVDVTTYVRNDPPLRISRGTSRVSRPRPGTLTLTLSNNDRRFDPDYASGPYANDLVPMVPIRVRATHNSTTYDLFRGFVSDWGVNTEDFKDSTVTVTAVDGLSVLELLKVQSLWEIEVKADSPKAWYRFSEPVGATTLVDSSGNGRHGGSISGATPQQTGFSGADRAFGFDETDDVVTPPEAGFLPSTGGFTIEGVVKVAASGDGAYLYWHGPGTSTFLIIGKGDDKATAGYAGQITTTDLVSAATYADNEWHHLAFTFDGTDAWALYVDGASVDTHTESLLADTIRTWQSDYPAQVGRFNNTFYSAGRISELVIYESALSSTRIAAHSAAALAPWDNQLTSARIAAILDAAGWPSADRDLDTGVATMDEVASFDKTALSLIFEAVDTEGGAAWISKAGKLWFGNRRWRDIATYSATFSNDGSDTGVQNLGWARDDTLLRTVAQVSDVNSQTLEYVGASEATYGPRTISRTTFTTSVTEPYDYATWLYGEFGTPYTNANLAVVAGAGTGNATWAEILSRELGDLVNVEVKPVGGTTQNDWDMIVEELQLTAGVDRWHMALGLTNANGQRGFVLDDDVLGELDGVGRLGW